MYYGIIGVEPRVHFRRNDFRFCAFVCGNTCPGRVRNAQRMVNINRYLFANDMITQKLDILHYLKMLDQFNKIKLILLNYCQFKSLDNIKRINLGSQEEMCNLFNIEKTTEEAKLEVISYYRDKITKKEMTETDKLLLNNLNLEMTEKIFEN